MSGELPKTAKGRLASPSGMRETWISHSRESLRCKGARRRVREVRIIEYQNEARLSSCLWDRYGCGYVVTFDHELYSVSIALPEMSKRPNATFWGLK